MEPGQSSPARSGTGLMLKPAQRGSLVHQVAGQLVDAIRTGQVQPGDRLVETRVAQQMATSRGPVREALHQLAENGLVEQVPGVGWFVTHPTRTVIVDMLVVRVSIESLAAYLVAARGDPADLDALTSIVESMRAAAKRWEGAGRHQELNWQFHETLCRASRNETLLKCWMMLESGLRPVMSLANATTDDIEDFVANHQVLVDALTSGSPAQAASLFRERALISAEHWLGRDVLQLAIER